MLYKAFSQDFHEWLVFEPVHWGRIEHGWFKEEQAADDYIASETEKAKKKP
jgi:hypothetical protein